MDSDYIISAELERYWAQTYLPTFQHTEDLKNVWPNINEQESRRVAKKVHYVVPPLNY